MAGTVLKRRGKKPRTIEHATTRQIIEGGAIHAADFLAGVVRGEVRRPSPTRVKAAMYILDQVLGKAVIKVEGLQGANITYNQLIIQAKERAAELQGGQGVPLPDVVPAVREAGDTLPDAVPEGDDARARGVAVLAVPEGQDSEAR